MRIFLPSMPLLALAMVVNLSSANLVERPCETGPAPGFLKLIQSWKYKQEQAQQVTYPADAKTYLD